MKTILKSGLILALLTIMGSSSEAQFIADFKLFNDGVIEDSLLQLAVRIENKTTEMLNLDIEWRIATDDGEILKQMQFPYRVAGDSQLLAYAPLHHFRKCGFYRIEAEISSADHTEDLFTNVVMNPEDIRSPLRKPEDFDAFWQHNLKQVSSFDMSPEIRLIEGKPDAKTHLYEVSLKSMDALWIKGWLEVPKKKGTYPTLFRVPGYTENLEPLHMFDDMIVFSLNVRDHGNSDNSGTREYEMWVRGLESQHDYFYKNIYLDCFMGLNYLASREDVDLDRIAVWGGSQGGGLSLVTAAFDKRVSLCIADIPFLTDWERYFEISHWYELDKWMSQHPDVTWSEILDVFSYFDTKNMAHMIECPVWMGIGLQDDVCPPATSFATYNLIHSPKRFNIYPHQFHSQPLRHYDNRIDEVRRFFGLD
jgi:cephalosporin-C deacetylase